MGALTRKVESLTDLEDAIRWAKTTDRTTVIVVKTDAYHLDAGRRLVGRRRAGGVHRARR